MDEKELERVGQLEAQQRQAELEAQKGNPHFQAAKQWGGQRKGAGAKPLAIRIGRHWKITKGQPVRVTVTGADGQAAERAARLELPGHAPHHTIELEFDDGERIVIAMLT